MWEQERPTQKLQKQDVSELLYNIKRQQNIAGNQNKNKQKGHNKWLKSLCTRTSKSSKNKPNDQCIVH